MPNRHEMAQSKSKVCGGNTTMLKPIEMTIQGKVQLMITDDQIKTGDKQDQDKRLNSKIQEAREARLNQI